MFSRASLMLVLGVATTGALGLAGACASDPPVADAPDGSTTTMSGGKGGSLTPSGTTDSGSAVGDGYGAPDVIELQDGQVCAETNEKARLAPVNMILAVDRSGSMGAGGTQSVPEARTQRWEPLKAALLAFFQSSDVPDVYASLDFFPAANDYDSGACDVVQYEPPYLEVPLSELGTPATTTLLTSTMSTAEPNGGTPTVAALQGSLEYASTLQEKQPNGKTMVVLITDGEPGFASHDPTPVRVDGCSGNNIPFIVQLVTDYAARTPPILTYVFGVGPNLSALNAIAQAGGTTRMIEIPLGDPTTTKKAFVDQLIGLRVREFSCGYTIPEPTDGKPIDKKTVNVIYTPGNSGAAEMLRYSEGCAVGNDTWKFVGDSVELCKQTCDRLSADPGAQISVKFGCQPTITVQ